MGLLALRRRWLRTDFAENNAHLLRRGRRARAVRVRRAVALLLYTRRVLHRAWPDLAWLTMHHVHGRAEQCVWMLRQERARVPP